MRIIHQESGPDTPIYNQRSRIMQNWAIIGRWVVPLSAVLNGRHGRRHGKFLYTVAYGTLHLYTGMTERSVYSRLRHHVNHPTQLGQCIRVAPIETFTIEVMEIDGDVCTAERQRIQQLRPPLNITEHYHSKKLVKMFVLIFISLHTKLDIDSL